MSTPTSPLELADDPSLDLPFSAAGPRAVNPAGVSFANFAAVQVGVEDLIGTELVADIDHLSRFGDAVRERFTVQPADEAYGGDALNVIGSLHSDQGCSRATEHELHELTSRCPWQCRCSAGCLPSEIPRRSRSVPPTHIRRNSARSSWLMALTN